MGWTHDIDMNGSKIRAWRKGIRLSQTELAKLLGFSQASLCRLEKENLAFTDETKLAILAELMAKRPEPDAPIIQSLREPIKTLAVVPTLADIGNIYQYKDCMVVPSQFYARWSNNETRVVNQAIGRLEECNRVEHGIDFFKLGSEEAREFLIGKGCDLSMQEIAKGLYLLTRSGANSLTHYFNDPNSIIKSKLINRGYNSFEEIHKSGLSSKEKMYLIADYSQRWIEADNERAEMAQNMVEVWKATDEMKAKIVATDAKVDAHKIELTTKIDSTDAKVDEMELSHEELVAKLKAQKDQIAELTALNADNPLTNAQKSVITPYFGMLEPKYGDYRVASFCKNAIKDRFLPTKIDSTWHDTPQRYFSDLLEFVKNWTPTVAQLKALQKKPKKKQNKQEIISNLMKPQVQVQVQPPPPRPQPQQQAELVLEQPQRTKQWDRKNKCYVDLGAYSA